MYDTWITAMEKNEISAVIMLDMSAAFDVVDTSILLGKMKIYGFDESSIEWFQSYMTGRSQKVYIDGHLSDALSLEVGVPQGSILWPLLHILYSNDLPEVVHNNHEPQNGFYKIHCKECGGMCCYADDSTYTFSHANPDIIKEKIDTKYQDIANYMVNNKLVLNTDKTHLLVMTTANKHRSNGNFGITLNTGNEIIEPDNYETILGGILSNNLKWSEHIRDNKKSLFKCLTTRVNALAKISKISNFKTRKMIANGIFLSKLIYLIQIWGGCSDYLLNFLQVLQNRAARFVTKLGHGTSVKTLLTQCGWLSVRQLTVYHSLNFIYKTKRDKKPKYFNNIFSREFAYKTRLADGSGIRTNCNDKATKTLTQQNFTFKAIKTWNDLPIEIRAEASAFKFKTKIKAWIKSNVSIY